MPSVKSVGCYIPRLGLVFAWLCALCWCAGPLAQADDSPPPNILLIISDDQGWTDFGFMGHPVIQTPHLDRLAKESFVFPQAYVPTSLCRASLATLLTGLYGHQHRICCNDPPEGVARDAMHPFIQSAPALPRLLQSRQYRSLQTGKFWEGHFSNAGFTHGMTVKGRHGDDGLVIGRQTLQPIDTFLAERGQQPFFVWYAPMLPHEPHNPPQNLLEKYQAPGRPAKLAAYYAMCEWFDQTVGQVLQRLDDLQLRDNTVVMFVVDNGWIQETGTVRTTRGWFAPKSKLSPYDGGLRFPLMICWPGKIRPGRSESLVSSIDVVPTLLAAAQVEAPPELPGVNLLTEATTGQPLNRTAVFGEIFEHTSSNLEQPALDLTHRWVREHNWKLILFEEPGHGPELYNLQDDPHEERNLALREPQRVETLTKAIDTWWAGRRAAPPLATRRGGRPPDKVDLFPFSPQHTHGSCVVECPNGDLLACWYRGSGERKADDVLVEGARLRRGDTRWSEPFPLADAPGFPDTNPCLFIDPQERLWLIWQTVVANEWHTALCRYKVSEDFLKPGPPTWNRADDLLLKPGPEFAPAIERHAGEVLDRLDQVPPDQREQLRTYLAERNRRATDKFFSRMGWMTRVHPVLWRERRMIVPLYSDGYDLALMALSDDGGQTWRASQPLVSLGGVQPSLAKRRDGSLVALMRDNGPPPQRALQATSTDGGETWSAVTDTDIPNPGSGLEVVVLKSGRWALVNNDTEQGRHRLSVWLSDDEGRSWPWRRAIEEAPPGPEADTASYPSLIQSRDLSLHLTYSFVRKGVDVPQNAQGQPLRETIRHAHFDEAWVMQETAE
jgi:arylsulfatase A-like enzyme/predicted neuraminidase